MTSHIKNILLLGGVSTLISTPLAYLSQNFVVQLVEQLWMIIFICCLIKLIITKKLAVLNAFAAKFPRFSVYLTFIGWLPYLATLFSAVLVGIDILTQNDDIHNYVINTQIILEYAYAVGFIISLLAASCKVFIKKV